MGGGVVAVEVAVDGVLELLALFEIRFDPVLVEEALEEDVFHRQAGGLQSRARLHPELSGGRADHVGRSHHAGLIEPLAVGDDGLACGLKATQRQADFVGSPRLHADLGQADQQALDPPVALRPMQGLNHRHDGGRAAAEGCKGILRVLIGKRAAQVQLQDHLPRHRRRAGGAGRNDNQQKGNAHQKEGQAGEHASHGGQELLHRGSVQGGGLSHPISGPIAGK